VATGGPEGVDLESLRAFFADHVAGADGRPLSAELIAGGRSNLTYGIGDGEHEWVLRRPPLGHVLPTAHDMAREYKVLTALADTDVPVPRTYALCEDTNVNGAPFYVMERVHGRILRDGEDLARLTPDEATACSRELVDVLARIHGVDYEAVGLGDFGHPDGFMERQLRRWNQQWERSKAEDLPEIDDLARRLRNALPESGPPTIVHGDYRLDNLLVGPDDKIAAVVDWEMATLGDPLTDLGLLVVYQRMDRLHEGPMASSAPGFPSETELLDRYAHASGRNLSDLGFYIALGSFKLAVILEGIHYRYVHGQTVGDGFDQIGERVQPLVVSGLAALRKES
jgi:aminoglycoside phosphotransferase (APT) family kinase protein